MKLQLSMFAEFLSITSKATIETSNSVVILTIADFRSATGAASTQPNHYDCPGEVHQSTVVLLAMNSSAFVWHSSAGFAMGEKTDYRKVAPGLSPIKASLAATEPELNWRYVFSTVFSIQERLS